MVTGACFPGVEAGWQSPGVAVWLWRVQHCHHPLLLSRSHCLPAAPQWRLRCGKHPGWKVRAFCQGSVCILPLLWQTSVVESESFLSGVCLHFASLVANICGGK